MKTIFIGFSKPLGNFKPFAWAIKKWQGTEYSHVYIRIPSTFLQTSIIYQASGTAVNMMDYTRFVSHNHILEEFAFNISSETERRLLQSALINLGASYSIVQILGIALAKLINSNKNPFTDARVAYVCSELVAEILVQYLGADIKEDLDLITPKDIYEVVKVLGKAP